jgi:hypothetical protein
MLKRRGTGELRGMRGMRGRGDGDAEKSSVTNDN